jgi:hypothetical protein
MKTKLLNRVLRRVIPAGMCVGLACSILQAEDKPIEPQSKPNAEKPAKPAPVKVPFLGLALGPLDESLAAQLNLPEGVGVLVRAVMPGSPAASAGVLQHDVLHYFNDQLLVNEAQLQTLVRQAGIGTEVALKLLRKGAEQSVVVKLGEHEERDVADARPWHAREPGEHRSGFFSHPSPDTWMFDMNSDKFADKVRDLTERLKNLEGKSADQIREEVERFQKEIQEQGGKAADSATKQADSLKSNSPARGKAKVWKDDKGGIHVELRAHDDHADAPASVGVTATADGQGTVTVTQTNNTRTTWNDSDGSGELLMENGKKKLTARDRDGKEIFSGPIDTEEQLKSLPASLRERLKRLESKVKVEVRAGKPAGDL